VRSRRTRQHLHGGIGIDTTTRRTGTSAGRSRSSTSRLARHHLERLGQIAEHGLPSA
jgi:hypothetical protein